MAVVVDIPGFGKVNAQNAAEEATLKELLRVMKGMAKGGGGGAGWPGGSPPMPAGLQSNGSPCGTGGSAAGNSTPGANGNTNRGGGGGGNGNSGSAPTTFGGNGGSGIVVIRYKFQ